MTRYLLFIAVVAAAAVASCKNDEQPVAEPTGAAAPGATAPAETPPSPSTPAPSPNEPVDSAGADEIPTAIQGTWGMNEADCDTSRGDAKGNLRIGPKKLEFYESVAALGKVQERASSRIRATYTFEGEGQTWTQDVVLDVQDGGKRLVRRDYGPDAMPGPLQYMRCR